VKQNIYNEWSKPKPMKIEIYATIQTYYKNKISDIKQEHQNVLPIIH